MGPFSTITGQIRQATPIGESLMIRSMIFMDTSLKLSTTWAATSPFSPASRMPKPTRREMTMTWSMEALASGVMGLEGKMSMMVCISDWPAGGS